MKKWMSKKGVTARVLTSTIAFVLVVCALTLCVSAASALTDTSMTYDFQTYASATDAAYRSSAASSGGWRVSGDIPTGASGQATIAVTMGAVGSSDYVTRGGNGIYENLVLSYVVPEADRIAIKDYDAIEFTRQFFNATYFARSGATYKITLVMDDGQTVVVEKPWVDLEVGADEEIVFVHLYDEITALEGDPVLVEILYQPYCNVEHFSDTHVVEENAIVQFLTKYISFKKAMDKPALSVVEDTYDGKTVTEHTGKITGFDPDITYQYKLTYATEWTTVTGITEIEGLAGAAYRVQALCTDESGLLDSEVAAVDVPKAVNTPPSYLKYDFQEGFFLSEKTTEPIIGYWNSTYSKPYNSAGMLSMGAWLDSLNGVETNDGGALYRRNELYFNYTFTPEEQIDISKSSLKFTIACAMSFPYLSYEEVMGVFKIYVSTLDEPLVIANLQHQTGGRTFVYNLANAFPGVTGYIERIQYFPLYEHLSEAIYSNSYPQITDFVITELLAAPAPNLFTIDMGDNVYKILGFAANSSYEMSRDGVTWEDLPANTTSIEVTEIGDYLFRQKEDQELLSGAITKVIIKARRPAPEGISISGTTLTGLDPDVTYEYALYTLGSTLEYTKVTGVDSISGLTYGVWAIRFPEDGENFASDNACVFVDGSSKKGKVNLTAQTDASARGFIPGELSSDVRQVSWYKAMNNSRYFVMYAGWPVSTNMEVNSELNVNYAFTPEQAFDIKELYSFTTRVGFQGAAGFFLNGGSYSGFNHKLRIYVAGSDVEYYDVFFPWFSPSYSKTMNIADLLPANAHGYVVGYKFYYFGSWPEISNELKSGASYPTILVYDMGISTKVATPSPVVSYSAGEFIISGLNSSYSHGYSTDGVNFVEIASGTTSFSVQNPGVYYVYAENYRGMKSNLAEIVVSLDGELPENLLTVLNGKITGLDSTRSYEYRKYSLSSENEFITVPAGTTEISSLTSGLWEVRCKNDEGAYEKSQYLLIDGNEQGSLSYRGIYNAVETDDGERGFVSGRWTNSLSKAYYDYIGNDSLIRFASGWETSLDQTERDAFYFSYQLTDDEIVHAYDMKELYFRSAFGNACPFSNDVYSLKIRYYVVGGNEEYYEEVLTPTKYNTFVTSNLSALAENDGGYVVGIRVWPFAVLAEGTTLVTTGNRYPTLALKATVIDSDTTDPRYRYRVVYTESTKPSGIRVEEAELNFFQKYKIAGLSASKSYEFSIDGTTYTALDAGTTEIAGLVGGEYWIRYAGSEDAVHFTTPEMTPAFLNTSISKYPVAVSEEELDGIWACYPVVFGTEGTYATAQISGSTPLNAVKFTYTFSNNFRFTVNKNPIFTIDFNNELVNLGLSTAYIPDAVARIEIKVMGRDEPLVIEKTWAGNEIADGYTANRIIANLLELDNTTGSFMVESFTVYPYSNITATPASYNESGSVNFSLINAGFFSTYENVASLTSETLSAVNELVDVTFENIPDEVGVGETVDLDAIVVTAHYSDGTSARVDNSQVLFDVPSFEKSGIYTFKASYRDYVVEKTIISDIDLDSLRVLHLPDKTVYYVGQMFVPAGLELVYTTTDGYTVVVEEGYEVASVLFSEAGEHTIPVSYAGTTLEFTVTVLPEGTEITLSESSSLTIDEEKRLRGVCEKMTVANLVTNFSGEVTVFDRAGAEIVDFETYVGTGFVVATKYNGEIADSVTVVITGDVNGNGTVDTNDYMLIKRCCLGTINLPEDSVAFDAADVNGNARIDSNDYLQIKNHYRGLTDLFN